MYQVYSDELYHHGIKGQKWGVRRFQNEDGSLTAAGKNRYDVGNYTASNGVKVAGARNSAIGIGRKLISGRAMTNLNVSMYRNNMAKRHANTLTNRLETEKGEKRIRAEAAALREYNAKIKDTRRNQKAVDKLNKKATVARESADEWDEIAAYAKNEKRRNEALEYAKKDREAANRYDARAKEAGARTKHLDKAIKKNRIDDAFEKVQSASSNLDRAIFNDRTRRLAAKYMVKNNMPMKDAVKKSRKVALASTAAALAIVGMANFAMYKQ